MKTLIMFFGVCTLFMSAEVYGQPRTGKLMMGAQLANISGTFQNNSNQFHLGISPSAAYFFRDNLAVGAMLDLGMDVIKGGPTTFTYGIGPWARYYFTQVPDEMKFSKYAAFFLDGFAGIQGVTHNKGGGNTNGLGIKVGPGISYFITPDISLDGSVYYNLVLGFGNATTANKVGINLGFQIFLPTKRLENRYYEETE
jgi:hypothetical protein